MHKDLKWSKLLLVHLSKWFKTIVIAWFIMNMYGLRLLLLLLCMMRLICASAVKNSSWSRYGADEVFLLSFCGFIRLNATCLMKVKWEPVTVWFSYRVCIISKKITLKYAKLISTGNYYRIKLFYHQIHCGVLRRCSAQ